MPRSATGTRLKFAAIGVESVPQKPDSMPMAQAAAFPGAYGTAWFALVDRGQLRAGEVLLKPGAILPSS